MVPTGIAVKSDGIEPSAASALPLAGLTAVQALFTKSGRTFTGDNLGSLQAGQKLLILGGATLVGMYAIQLAKNVGAHVAVTASENKMLSGETKMAYCKSLGADEVIDYKTAKWTEVLAGQDYDMIFDTIGAEEDWVNASKVLRKGCDFISVANFGADVESNKTNNFKNFLLKSNAPDLAELVGLVKEDKLKLPVDLVMDFKDVPAAITKSLKGQAAGKIVVSIKP